VAFPGKRTADDLAREILTALFLDGRTKEARAITRRRRFFLAFASDEELEHEAHLMVELLHGDYEGYLKRLKELREEIRKGIKRTKKGFKI